MSCCQTSALTIPTATITIPLVHSEYYTLEQLMNISDNKQMAAGVLNEEDGREAQPSECEIWGFPPLSNVSKMSHPLSLFKQENQFPAGL